MSRVEKIMRIYKEHGGFLRTADALRLGIYSRELYAMKSSGILEEVTRGLYRLSGMSLTSNFDLLTVALKVPKGIVCLISALAFHELTLHVPHEIYLAMEAGSMKPRLDYPPLRLFWMSENVFLSGVETHTVKGIKVRMYSIEKTIADCFKFRNKIGVEVAFEALRLYRNKKKFNVKALLKYAKICRVEKIMKPYLEALV